MSDDNRGERERGYALERWTVACRSRRARIERTRALELTTAIGECEAAAEYDRARRAREIDDLQSALTECSSRASTALEAFERQVDDVRARAASYAEKSREKCLELDVQIKSELAALLDVESANANIESQILTLRARVELHRLEKRLQAGYARLLTFRRARAALSIQRAFRRWIVNGRKRPKKKKKSKSKSKTVTKKPSNGAKPSPAKPVAKLSSKTRAKSTVR